MTSPLGVKCNKIDKPLVVYRFDVHNNAASEMRFQVFFMSYDKKESNICALVILNLLNSLRKRDKMLSKPSILSFS